MDVSNRQRELFVYDVSWGFGTRLEFACDHVRFSPNSVMRLIGEPTTQMIVPSQSAEILLCHNFRQGRPNGWRIIVRGIDGAEIELGGNGLIRLNARDLHTLSDAIPPATGLPARIVIRRQAANGTIEELPWNPSVAKTNSFVSLKIISACLPFVAGVTMGYLSPHAPIVIGIGLALWLGLMLALFAVSQRDPSGKEFPVLYALTTLVSFSAIYAACFVVTAYLSHHN